ncbi:MAG: AhpC/TSA family protein [Bryobacteraceae bacterium]|nr:AhpC/TSA family protein [Bryobacteraceae bacterium]
MTTLKASFALLLMSVMAGAEGAQPQVGSAAPDFTLTSFRDKSVRLSDVSQKGTVVLVVLRGFPGYQCPMCNRQVQDFVRNAKGFSDAGARVVMVYPGPAEGLGGRASEFVADKNLPPDFELLLDPDYKLTNLYGLRWDAPKETAYPSTFVMDDKRMISFAKISNSHGGRTSASEVLEALHKKKASN